MLKSIHYWFYASIALLVLSKVFTVIELTIFTSVTIDADRLFALIFFIATYIYWSSDRFDGKSINWLMFYGLSITCIAVGLQLDWIKVVVLFFMTALVEEILLRGVLYEWLLMRFSALRVLIVSSLFFTLVHPAVYDNYFYGMAVLLTGLLLGSIYLYFRQKSREVAVVHATGLHGVIIVLGLYLGMI